jgi:peptide/nickel transport system ATP-binding protein
VKDVGFTLRQNEFVGIVGESGSGKSTLARLIVGLETPSAGRIAIAGRQMDGSAEAEVHRRRHVQMVFQDPQSALNPRRRVASIVTQPLEAGGQSWEARLARAGLLLAEIGLPGEAAARFPAQLSGGQRQRVNIARALCAAPRILIADEIVSGLDVSVQAQLLNLLAALRRERGFSMLFISHDLSVVRYLCDRVLVMVRGEVVESGPTEQVFAAPAHDYTRTLLAAVPPDDPAEVWQGLRA